MTGAFFIYEGEKVMAKGISTINTVLKMGTGTSLDKVTPIKSYPDLFGTPDQIEITDLEDEIQKFVPGK